MSESLKSGILATIGSALCTGATLILSACGGGQYRPPPVTLSVSLSNPTVVVSPGSSVSVPVVVVAPTETVTFTINGLPPGVSQNYKESESNPSGLLTLTAGASAQPGTYKPTIVVGSSGQNASFVFTLVIATMNGSLDPGKFCQAPSSEGDSLSHS